MNWKILKVVGAFVVILGIVFWAFTATRSQSYSGTDLDFEVASGLVMVTNPSEQSIAAEFTQLGTRSFTVRSNIEGVSGTSTRLDVESGALHQFEFALPAGTSEFTITRGDDVMFVASAPIELEATVNPMTADSSRNVVIAAIVAIAGLLFYASNTMEHRWIGLMMGQSSDSQDIEPTPVVATSAQGRSAKSFGDNRSNPEV